jgi:hypothetical protein
MEKVSTGEGVYDQSAAAKLVEKEQRSRPSFAYFAEVSTSATLGPIFPKHGGILHSWSSFAITAVI